MSRKLLTWVLALSLGVSIWAARRPGQALKPGFNLFSKQQDIDLGQANAKQVLEQYEVARNQFLQDYIRRVGDRLTMAKESKDSGFPFTFTVLNVSEVNAFALCWSPLLNPFVTG